MTDQTRARLVRISLSALTMALVFATALLPAFDLDVEAKGKPRQGQGRDRAQQHRRDRGMEARAQVAAGAAPPANAPFDYQIGGDYPLPAGVQVVSRDWFSGGTPPEGIYGICYVNAYQTQANEEGVDRPDEQANWPAHLVLTALGDDPKWGGEYLIDISTAEKRAEAAQWVKPMLEACAIKGFQGVEFDNLDSWTRFEGTPLQAQVPFGRAEAVAYATLLAAEAHHLGLAVGQKNTAELTFDEARTQIRFDFAIAEECGRYNECQTYRGVYQDNVIVIEYRMKDFNKVCKTFGAQLSIVLRDRNVTPHGVYRTC